VAWGDVFGWIGAVIFVARLLPQPWKMYRYGVRDGVSWLGTANATVATTGWLIYGLGVGEPVLWVPSLVALVPEVAAVTLLGWRPPSRRDAAIWTGWMLLVVLAWPLGGRLALGAVIGIGIVAGVVPHVVTVLRSPNVDGVAKRTWQIALLDAALWGAYSIGAREPMTGFYAIVLGGGAAVILWRLSTVDRVGHAVVATSASDVPAVGPIGAHANDV
jgi:uncharacterized protein with PQ loop repeat